ncbi:MAG: hypothetical protein ACYS8I_07435 [Planctomycetota bacterium]|jgi:hypothetical protein
MKAQICQFYIFLHLPAAMSEKYEPKSLTAITSVVKVVANLMWNFRWCCRYEDIAELVE